MPYRIWMVDVAREQCLNRDHLFQYASVAQEAGFDLGLYLEHRFAYPSAMWAAGKGCLTPGLINDLKLEFPSLKVIPFINVLSHMEGFIYSEEGRTMREELFKGLQGCPCNPDFVKLCQGLIDDTIQAFDSDLIHIGGDETTQLGICPQCRELGKDQADPKAAVYAHHFAPLLKRVIDQGRTPAVWGDMILEHPTVAPLFPKQTVIFDWNYKDGIAKTAPKLKEHGHQVVGCPGFHVWDAAWFHTEATENNIREISRDIRDQNLDGFCLTAWENGLFGAADTLWPAVKWAAQVAEDSNHKQSLIQAFGPDEGWAKLMSEDLEAIGGVFQCDGHRQRLKSRLLMYSNPFLAWMHHHDQLYGTSGDEALRICEKALQAADGPGQKGVTIFVRAAVEFVRMAESAHRAYAKHDAEKAVAALAPTRYLFDTLESVAKQTHERIGGSLADIYRCRAAKTHVELVIKRIRDYGKGELGYLPAFDVITNPRFVPHDQACWWLVNSWGNE